VEAVDSWSNPDYVFDPVLGIQLVLRRDGRVIENRFVAGKVADPEVLRSYYHRVHAGHGYTPSEPFLFELHAAMLRRLERIFLEHIPAGARVLDAGCGRSLFTEIDRRWPFAIVAADVDHDLLLSRKREHPEVTWVVGDAHPLPFAAAAFDALFAGELIEHLPDPAAGVAEFRRVLKPGGTLVLTTPNRLRLANRVDRSERPYSPDHLSELSYDEARDLLAQSGFDIVASTGVHLELLLNWGSPMPKLDRLQRRWNRPWAVPLMRACLALGALAPRHSLDLIFVARRAR
jgi:SAM-dependent methyltransferase